MSNPLIPTSYAQYKYNITQPIDFQVGINYACVLMAIAGADGELSEQELQWYIDEQKILFTNADEYIEAVKKIDWKKANLEQTLKDIQYEFPVNFRRVMLYQAIQMTRGDGIYHEKEEAAVSKAAEILGIDRSIVVTLESMAALEDASAQLRLAVFETVS